MKKQGAHIKHPSPARAQVGWLPLFIGLFGAPTSWAAQILLSQILASYACYPHQEPLQKPVWGWLYEALSAISLVCFITGALSAYVAWRSWRKTRREKSGHRSNTWQTGEGRTRFMCLLGAMVSLLFMITMLFNASAILLVDQCQP